MKEPIASINPSQETKDLIEDSSTLDNEIAEEKYRRERAAKNRALTEERRRAARLEEIEERVTVLESQLSEISHQLARPPSNQEVVAQLGDEYVEIQNELEALIREWEGLHQKISP